MCGTRAGSHSLLYNLHSKNKNYDHYCPVHVSNYLQYVARSSHGVAKVDSVKVSGILESIETLNQSGACCN